MEQSRVTRLMLFCAIAGVSVFFVANNANLDKASVLLSTGIFLSNEIELSACNRF
jgi:hypothetical protein